ncbi:protocadherin-7-like [Babylonia areolata]|uniref:protocadherin-7-like n=1 Tax=Babylonia areolata TaxID=304850 RepID=UPI003FD32941
MSFLRPYNDVSFTRAATLVLFLLLSLTPFSPRGARGQDISVVYSLDEGLPAGTFVGNVAQDSNLRDLVGSEAEFRALTYSFLAGGGGGAGGARNYFRLQNDSGILSTRRVLDREALCSFLQECRLSLRMAAQSSQSLFFRTLDVSVMVNDVNDNAPSFQPPSMNLAVLENADVGDLFQLTTAVDADAGANHSVRRYSLLTSDVPFGLQAEGGEAAVGGARLWLKLTGPLDRETVPTYRLLVVATDGGPPVRSGTLTVNVEVEDVNDHAPEWDQDSYAANVSEIEAVGSAVLTLRAHDQDVGDNAVVVYRFSPLQADIALGLFALNRTSGELSVAKPLDNYAGQTYSLEVEARDSGTPFKTSRADVVVHVMDTHNSRPEMILSVFGQGNVTVLSESSGLGRVVAHIGVEDPDSGLNGIVLCRTNASHFKLQPMDVMQYKVILGRPLDRETQAEHEVLVTCQDAGSPPLAVSQTFTVQVRDENDHSPVFSPSSYQARVNESVEGSVAHDVYVTSLSATDDDEGENARISYLVIDDPNHDFRVLDNGTLLAVRGLDRDSGDNPREVRVVAHDHGTVENSATATVTLTLLDLNDNPPLFPEPPSLFHISEGSQVGSPVGNVTATDVDEGDNAQVAFRLHSEEVGRVPFEVLPEGEILTSRDLDREEMDRYQFAIVAYDHGSPSLSSTVTATIVVTDENDNSPVFVFPSPRNNTLRLPHTTLPHTVVTSLLAYDVDDGVNAQLTYSREGVNGSLPMYFDVVPTTGDVILLRPLTKHQLGQHVLTVAVHDQGTPIQLANQTLLFIHVFEANQSKVAVSSKEAESFRNTLLVVVIVAVTAFLSLAVGVAIVMMKRKDRQKRLYRCKEADFKDDDHKRHLASKPPWSHELHACPVPSDLAVTSSEQRRRKEVSFSLDEDNNIAAAGSSSSTTATAAVTMPDTGAETDSLEAIPEVAHSQKRLLGPRGPEDDASDASCDVSTSDSGRGGSDVEMHSQQGASRDTGDAAFASHHHHHHHPRGPARASDARRHLHPPPRNVTFDPYPLTLNTPRLTTFSGGRDDDDVGGQSSRQPMTSFSSFSPLPRPSVVQASAARASPSPSSSAATLPASRPISRVVGARPGAEEDGGRRPRTPSAVSSPRPPSSTTPPPDDVYSSFSQPPLRPLLHHHHPLSIPQPPHHQSPAGFQPPHNHHHPQHPHPTQSPPRPPSQGEGYIDLQRQRQRQHGADDPRSRSPMPSSSSSYVGGSYVHLKEQRSPLQQLGDGDFVGANAAGAATYVPSSMLSGTSSGACDGETTTSGSYTLDPQDRVQEIDQLFFDPPGDVVV